MEHSPPLPVGPDVVYESETQRLRWLPITAVTQDGCLRLEAGRLTFRTSFRERQIFDIPANEIHSVAPMATLGFHCWHGSTRYRFALGTAAPVTHLHTGSDIADIAGRAAQLPAAFAHDAEMKVERKAWVDLLSEHACQPPPEVRVRKPWPGWAWAVGVLLASAVLIGGIVAVTLLTL
jgi:hypothetical protein